MRLAIEYLVVAFMVVGSALLYAQNNMPIMQTFFGEYEESALGRSMAALDFNADGFDDLVLYSRKSSPSQLQSVDIYFGGVELDTIPDLTWQAVYEYQISYSHFMAAGDVNGDGYADLMLGESYPADLDSFRVHFCYGGPQPDLIPDHSILIPRTSSYLELYILGAIGDVNNDGYDDFGCESLVNFDSMHPRLEILLGGVWQRVMVVEQGISTQRGRTIKGVGDVNSDGIYDFIVGYGTAVQEGIRCDRYLYFGGNPLDLDNRILLYSTLDGSQRFSGAYGVGDFNLDGYDDFIYCTGDTYMDGNKLRLGGPDIMETEEITLHSETYHNLMAMDITKPVCGDFNGDNCMDIAGADYRDSLWDGVVGLWLGKTTPNGDYDLRLLPPPTSPYHQFGKALAAGDFNGDGYDDLAVSAPFAQSGSTWYHGYVYVYSGNPQLQDTTVAMNDPINEDSYDALAIEFFPNPCIGSETVAVSFRINEITLQTQSRVKITLYNIKGQKSTIYTLTESDLKSKQGIIPIGDLATGVYIAICFIDDRKVSVKKLTVL